MTRQTSMPSACLPRRRRGSGRPCARSSRGGASAPVLVLALVAVAAVLAALWFFVWQRPAPPAAPPAPAAVGRVELPASAPPDAPASAPVAVAEPAASRPMTLPEIESALTAWLGREAVAKFLQLDELPRRVAATTDNLPRSQAASRLWPVQRTPGRFATVERDGRIFIDPANAARYEPLVRFVEGLEPSRAADLYVNLLPMLQQAYEELGFPRHRFHARMMQVVDHLLAARRPAGPVELRLTEVRGSIESERPWVRYEYADPALEQASAGHKILMRIGPEQAQRLQQWLTAFRAEVRRREVPAPR